MDPGVETRLAKVKRLSRSARRVCFLLMALVTLITAVLVAATLAIPETLTCDVNGLRRQCSALSPQALTLTLVALIGGVGLVLTALYRLARLFQNYSRGEIFTRGSVREIRLLGYVAVAYAVLQLVLFVGTLVTASLLGRIGVELVRMTGLSLLDRLLGTVFGFARGVILVLVAVYLLRQLFPPQNLQALHHSQLMPQIDMLVQWVQLVFARFGQDLGPGLTP